METVEIIVGIFLIVAAIAMVALVLLQSSKSGRLSGTIAGGAETFFGKNKGKAMDKQLNKITLILAIVFAVIVIVLYVVQPGKAKINYGDFNSRFEQLESGKLDVTETTGTTQSAQPETDAEPSQTPAQGN